MNYRNQLLILTACLVTIAIGYWTYSGSIAPTIDNRAEIIRQNADYFLIGALIKEYDPNGALDYQLQAQSITHYLHNDNTLLQRPFLTSYSDNGQITTSQSENGKILPGGKDIELWDDVVVIQTGPPKTAGSSARQQDLRMDTDFITIFPDQQIVETERPVLITNNIGETRAVGMTAYYKQGKLQLKSRVRGVYEPE